MYRTIFVLSKFLIQFVHLGVLIFPYTGNFASNVFQLRFNVKKSLMLNGINLKISLESVYRENITRAKIGYEHVLKIQLNINKQLDVLRPYSTCNKDVYTNKIQCTCSKNKDLKDDFKYLTVQSLKDCFLFSRPKPLSLLHFHNSIRKGMTDKWLQKRWRMYYLHATLIDKPHCDTLNSFFCLMF